MTPRRPLGPNDPWIQTRTGRAVNLLNPFHGDVDFEDIAEALGQINRFSGHCRRPMSVACHTLAVADIVADIDPAAVPWALLHDAHEAYLGDITTPAAAAIGLVLREAMLGEAAAAAPDRFAKVIADLKRRHDDAILIASGLPVHAGYPDATVRGVVAHADAVALMWERRDLLGAPPCRWHPSLELLVQQMPRKGYPYLAGPVAATALMTQFRAHLPHLRPGTIPSKRTSP